MYVGTAKSVPRVQMTIKTLQDRMGCARISEHNQPGSQAPPFVVSCSRKRAGTIRHIESEDSSNLPTKVLQPNSMLLNAEISLPVETTCRDAPRPVFHGGGCPAP
ncbi:MAG: hypothetical protein CL912_22835 [Deltaproteobacteria bacterium]|nr:hypothetical protein [Deltaproteobacteria bacterium]